MISLARGWGAAKEVPGIGHLGHGVLSCRPGCGQLVGTRFPPILLVLSGTDGMRSFRAEQAAGTLWWDPEPTGTVGERSFLSDCLPGHGPGTWKTVARGRMGAPPGRSGLLGLLAGMSERIWSNRAGPHKQVRKEMAMAARRHSSHGKREPAETASFTSSHGKREPDKRQSRPGKVETFPARFGTFTR